MHIQEIYSKYVGGFGRYQKLVVLLLFMLRTPSFLHNMGYLVFARTPEHHCSFNENPNLNFTSEQWRTLSVPWDKKNSKWSQCLLYKWNRQVGNMTSETVNWTLAKIQSGDFLGDDVTYSCNRWDYDTWTDIHSSLVTKWDLVCHRAYMKSLLASIYGVGWVIGSPFAGYFADRFGRRLVLRITVTTSVILGIIIPFIDNYVVLLTARFFISVFINGTLAVSFAAAIEAVAISRRSLVSNGFMIVFALGNMLLGVVAYFVRDWFEFMIIQAAPCVILLVMIKFLPESISWLIAKGQKCEANKLLQNMAHINKRSLPDNIQMSVQEEADRSSTKISDLVRTKTMRKTSIILSFNWFTDALLYYAISWNSVPLHGNLYLNIFLAGFTDILAHLVNTVAVQYLGRRLSMSGTNFLGGILLFLYVAVPTGSHGLLVALTLTSKCLISMAFTTAYQYTCELYPTVIRTVGLVFCNVFARLGTILAPNLPLMVTQVGMFKEFPQIICGVLAVFAAISLLFLPETIHQKLPSTIEEAEQMHVNNRFRDVFRILKKNSLKSSEDRGADKPLTSLKRHDEI